MLPVAHIPAALLVAPTAAFWLNEVGFSLFEGCLRRHRGVVAREAALEGHFTGVSLEWVRTGLALAEPQDRDTVALHLVLLAEFIEGVRTAALVDVARSTGGGAMVDACRMGTDRWDRHRLALASFLNEPRCPLYIAICDRWHAMGRCVLRVEGRVHASVPLTAQKVLDATQSAVTIWTGGRDERHAMVVLGAFERAPGDVLVGLRRPARPGTLVDEAAQVVPGFQPEMVLLRVFKGAHRVDVTARRVQDALDLTDLVGSSLLGAAVHYVKRRESVTERVLAAFLARLIEPETDDLRLVEIKAGLPGEPTRATKLLNAPGHQRIEHLVVRESEQTAYCQDWRTVHHVKVSHGGYRFAVQFPGPGEGLRLTYSDLGRDKDVATSFEETIEGLGDHFGADIHISPRSADGGQRAARRRSADARPKRLTVDHWRRLFGPVLDDPADWEIAELDKLAREGLVAIGASRFLRCGDTGVNRNTMRLPDAALACTGEVEWNVGSVDEDPYKDRADQNVECSACGTPWRFGSYRPELHLRLRMTMNDEAVWSEIRRRFARLCAIEEEGPGIGSGLVQRTRVYLAWAPLSGKAIGHTLGMRAIVVSTCGRFDGVPATAVTLDLADVWTGAEPIKRAVDTACSGAPMPAAEGRPSTPPPTAQPVRRPALPTGVEIRFDKEHVLVVLRYGASKPFQPQRLFSAHANALRFMLAVLTPDEGDVSRAFRQFHTLTREIQALLTPDRMNADVFRLRKAFDRLVRGLGDWAIETPDNGAAHGYRLRREVDSVCDIGQEIQIFKGKQRKRG